MEFLNNALPFAAAAVLVLTELAKLIPARFTTDRPEWVNGILSVIAAVIVVKPVFVLSDIVATLGTALFIAVVAAIAYNQFTSKLVSLNKPKR